MPCTLYNCLQGYIRCVIVFDGADRFYVVGSLVDRSRDDMWSMVGTCVSARELRDNRVNVRAISKVLNLVNEIMREGGKRVSS